MDGPHYTNNTHLNGEKTPWQHWPLAAVESDGPLILMLSPPPDESSNVACCAETSPIVAAAGASAPKKMTTSKDANSMGQKTPTNKRKSAGHAKISAPKMKKTSKVKTTKEVYVNVVLAALATYNDLDYNNVQSAAHAAKQADIDAYQVAFHVKDYSMEEDSSGALKKKKSSSSPKSAPTSKKSPIETTKMQTTKEV